MHIAPFDAAGILVFVLIALFFYRRGWFFSFYSFFKFLLISTISLALGLFLASKNPFQLPITKLQVALLVLSLTFAVLWKFLSFKGVFFKATDSLIKINRFLFISRIDRLLNIIPSVVASFFVCFFLFSLLLSISTTNFALQKLIADSTIVKNAFYKVYFAALPLTNRGLFEDVAYKLVSESNTHPANPNITNSTIKAFADRLNEERQKIGLAPLVYFFTPHIVGPGQNPFVEPTQTPGTQTFIPTSAPIYPTATPPPPTPTPAQYNYTFFHQNPTNTPIPTHAPNNNFFPTATPTPFVIVITATPTPIRQIIFFPTATPTFVPHPTAGPQPTATPIPTSTPTPIPTPRPTPPPLDIGQVEQIIFTKTNQERAANGVAPLVWSDAIAAVARAHSQDMVNRDFFSHVNPDGLDPFRRLTLGGISYTAAAENINDNTSPDLIMATWMNSTGHRENILNPAYGKIGIGVAYGSATDRTIIPYSIVATQDFTN